MTDKANKLENFDAMRELMAAINARIERLEATREIARAVGCALDQVALDIAACKQLRRNFEGVRGEAAP